MPNAATADGGDAGTSDESAGPLVTEAAGTGGRRFGGEVSVAGGAPIGAASATDGGEGGSGGVVDSLCDTCSIAPFVLPAPCGNDDYATSLHVVGGTPPYTTSVSATSGAWSLEADPAHLDDPTWFRLLGAPAGGGQLALRFEDHTGRVFTPTYEVRPRAACWLAYVGLGSGSPLLTLVDPILKKSPPITLVNDYGVYDFRFSPDGRSLAYRYNQDPAQPSRGHLALVDLVTWQERALAFDSEDAVTAYAWSADSSVLAVAYDRRDAPRAASATTYLGGVRLVPGTGGSLQPVTLTPVAAPVQSDLYWAAGEYVVFHSSVFGHSIPNPAGQHIPYYAKLESQGFDSPDFDDTYVYDAAPALVVRPSASGFFLISAQDPFGNFYALPPLDVAVDHWQDVVSPSGAFTASVLGSQLRLFQASDYREGAPFVTSSPDFGCPRLLTWAKGRERLACIASVAADSSRAAHGEVRIFDLAGNALTHGILPGFCLESNGVDVQECAALEYDYDEQSSRGQVRAFSASGNWLAFTTSAPNPISNGYLYVADLRSSSFGLIRKDAWNPASASADIALSFSPDERYLVQQRDDVLTIHDVPSSGTPQLAQLVPQPATHRPVACSEDFATGVDRWCGNAESDALLAWSSDSRAFAYRTAQGLLVVDIDGFPTAVSRPFVADECDDECTNQFDFQPLP